MCRRFEWQVSRSDVASHTIELMVKNSTGVFSKGRVHMGQLQLDLSQFDDLTKATTQWYHFAALIYRLHHISVVVNTTP